MNGLMPLLLALVSGAGLFAFVNHFIIGLRKPYDCLHLSFSGFCLVSAILCGSLVYQYQINDVQQFIWLIKFQGFVAALYYIIQIGFVQSFTEVKIKSVFWGIVLVSISFAVWGLLRPAGLFVDSYDSALPPVDTFLGQHMRFGNPEYSSVGLFYILFTLAQYLYLSWCCLTSYRKKPDPSVKYLLVCISIYYSLIAVDLWIRASFDMTVYFSCAAFLVYIACMSTRMSSQSRSYRLEKSESKYRHLLEGVVNDYVVFSCDAKGKMLYVSPSSKEILGYAPDELVDWNDGMTEAYGLNYHELAEAFKKIASGYLSKFEVDFMTSKQKAIRLEVHTKPVFENGRLRAIEGYARDVTELKNNQLALQQLNEDLEKRVADRTAILEATLAELREEIDAKELLERQLFQSQKIESIGQLAGGVAHDFNNIMTAIRGFAEISINESRKGNEITADLEQILEASDRGANLTNQLLGFARKQMAMPRVVNPNEIISNTVKLLPRLLETNITINFNRYDDAWPIKIDPVQLDQILINLAVNARDAMPNGGDIFIDIRNVQSAEMYERFDVRLDQSEYFCLCVRDTGNGMSVDVQNKIFEPFFTTKPVGKGSGLGLAVCYGVVKQYGGYIFVESELGVGSEFFILLPRSKDSAQKINATVVNASAVIEGGDETILLVEDDASVAMLTERVLASAGYQVLTASNGLQALDIAEKRSGEIDLMITDIMMPKMNGKELIEAIKLLTPNIGIICLSGYADDEIITEVVSKGVTFIKKPYTPLELAKTVRSVIDCQHTESVIF